MSHFEFATVIVCMSEASLRLVLIRAGTTPILARPNLFKNSNYFSPKFRANI